MESLGTGAERVKVLLPFYLFTFLPFYLFTFKKAFLPFYLFNVRNEDILINLTIILTSRESERYRYYRARSKLALSHITQHGGSILVLVLATHLLQDDVTFHHLSVLTLLALHGKSLALLHHSHNL